MPSRTFSTAVEARGWCSEALWTTIRCWLPDAPGRCLSDDREILAAILYSLHTGHGFVATSRRFNTSSATMQRRFTEWRQAGVFTKLYLVRQSIPVKLDWKRVAPSTKL